MSVSQKVSAIETYHTVLSLALKEISLDAICFETYYIKYFFVLYGLF